MKIPHKDDLKNPGLQFQLVLFMGDLYWDAYKMHLLQSVKLMTVHWEEIEK